MSLTAKALWYVESHLAGDATLEAAAESAGVSRYHLSRAFSAAMGCGLAAYVRARRLSEAAKTLRAGAADILAVALDSGYGSHEAFTRAFRQHFGVTPEQTRARGELIDLKLQEPIRMPAETKTSTLPVRVIEHPAMLIFGLGEHYSCAGDAAIPAQWQRFVPYIGNIAGQIGRVAYGVICSVDDANNFDYVCGVEVPEFPAEPKEFMHVRIPPQTYAVFRHEGHISSIQATFAAIWNRALPESGFKPVDSPCLERYGEEFDGRTGLGGVEIWVAIEKPQPER